MVAPDIANVVSFGAGRETYRLLITSLALFGPGVLFFTVHYLMLRGFYALERTRTVFWVQCVIAATNIVVALVLVHDDRRPVHLARAGARLHRVVRRGLAAVLPAAAPRARRPARPACCSGSWCGC